MHGVVVQKSKMQSTIAAGDLGAVFAATPPLECLRLTCSLFMSSEVEHTREGVYPSA